MPLHVYCQKSQDKSRKDKNKPVAQAAGSDPSNAIPQVVKIYAFQQNCNKF